MASLATRPVFAIRAIGPFLGALGAYHLGIAAWMTAAPHSFFARVGPFGSYNAHYLRDNATWEAALGVLLLLAVARPAWRLAVVALATVQCALHAVNHVVDVDAARAGSSAGVLDAVSLALLTVVLVAVLILIARTEGTEGGR